MADGRTRKSLRNTAYGVASQLVAFVTSFAVRTVFVWQLGLEILGLNGLYTNVLNVLSLADLGFGTAMVFAMYRPLRERDERKVSALVNLYRRVYTILGVGIAVLGGALTPLLPVVVNLPQWDNAYYGYYLLALAGVVATYFYAHRIALLQADQQIWIVHQANIAAALARAGLQLAALLVWRSFTGYLLIQLGVAIGMNIFLAVRSRSRYPYLGRDELPAAERAQVYSDMKYLGVYKFASVILTHTDNIIISVIVGTVVVGYYSNYLIIVTALTALTWVVVEALTASIGHLNAGDPPTRQYAVFNEILLVAGWMFGAVSVLMLLLFNDFITLWLGADFTLDWLTVLAICVGFYVVGIHRPVIMYRETTGIFRQTAKVILVTALLNLVLSVILGMAWGIAGVLIATPISRLATNTWYEPLVLFRLRFEARLRSYFGRLLVWAGAAVVAYLLAAWLCDLLPGPSWGIWLAKAGIGALVCAAVFTGASLLLPEFAAVRRRLRNLR
ncbi:MAG: polysaccharide biosynthesis C-terminal domain-containing protein [Propionibacteriaceae bacterium]|nr:polysaccharide biosynthesis C-terminal domain-containing protein [Propionibacteriaceae bacterium]